MESSPEKSEPAVAVAEPSTTSAPDPEFAKFEKLLNATDAKWREDKSIGDVMSDMLVESIEQGSTEHGEASESGADAESGSEGGITGVDGAGDPAAPEAKKLTDPELQKAKIDLLYAGISHDDIEKMSVDSIRKAGARYSQLNQQRNELGSSREDSKATEVETDQAPVATSLIDFDQVRKTLSAEHGEEGAEVMVEVLSDFARQIEARLSRVPEETAIRAAGQQAALAELNRIEGLNPHLKGDVAARKQLVSIAQSLMPSGHYEDVGSVFNAAARAMDLKIGEAAKPGVATHDIINGQPNTSVRPPAKKSYHTRDEYDRALLTLMWDQKMPRESATKKLGVRPDK